MAVSSKFGLCQGLDEFLDSVTVLPPGEWDRNIRIEPPTTVPSQENLLYIKPEIPLTTYLIVFNFGTISLD